MSSISISVIVPVYNSASFLSECLASILQQSLQEIEVLCIDDGSSDNSLDIIHKFAEQDTRIIVISRENRGVGHSRNEGILKAQGKYVAFMDSDDLYPSKDVLEVLYHEAEKNQVQIAGGSFAEFSSPDLELKTNFCGDVDGFSFQSDAVISYSDYQFDYGFYRFIYNRRMLIDNRIDFPPYQRFQDPPFFVRAMLQAGRFYATKKITYAYRIQHKLVNWNKRASADFCKGLNDVYLLAKQHKLRKLLIYCYQRFCWHWPYISQIISTSDLSLLKKIEINYLTIRQNFGRWLFSCKKSITRQYKYIIIFGLRFTKKVNY